MKKPTIQKVELDSRHVSAAVRKALKEILAPRIIQKGGGEFEIGREYAKNEIKEYLKQVMGPL